MHSTEAVKGSTIGTTNNSNMDAAEDEEKFVCNSPKFTKQDDFNMLVGNVRSPETSQYLRRGRTERTKSDSNIVNSSIERRNNNGRMTEF